MAFIRQTSFSAGELSPYLYGRTDLEMHAHGARTLLNFFVNRQGNAVSRPGTKKFVEARGADVVLIPFILSDTVSYVLEFSEYYVRIYTSGSSTLVQEIAIGYPASALPQVQFAQSGAVMTLTHPDFPPKELRAPVAGLSTVWAWRDVMFGARPDDYNGTQGMVATFKARTGQHVLPPVLVSNPTLALFDNGTHKAREWKWKASTTYRHNITGEYTESSAVDVTEYFDGPGLTRVDLQTLPSDNLVILLPDSSDGTAGSPVVMRFPLFGPLLGTLSGQTNWTEVGINFYRGRGGLYGLVGQTDYAQAFVDLGAEPNYLIQPLRADNPFTISGHPACVSFFQQRRIFASSRLRPSTWWTSAVDEFNNFAPSIFAYDSMPLEATLTGRKRERIVTMLQLEHLLAFTDSSVWAIGRAEFALTPENLPSSVRMVDEVGALPLMPLAVDGAALYVRAKGRGVRELRPTQGGFDGQDATWHAEHLFRGTDARIVSWCFQRDPWGVVWAVRDDGVLLSCTRTGSGWAWAEHETGEGDEVLSVTCVPETDGDAVFLAVRRGATTYIERMMGAAELNDSTSFPLDCHITATAPASVADYGIGGLSHLEGREVWAVSDGKAPQGPLTVTGGEVVLQPWQEAAGTLTVAIGLPYTCDLELLDARPGSMNQKAITKVGFEVDSASGLQVGEDFEHLVPWQQRTVMDSYEYPSAASALVVVTVKGSFRRTGRAVLRQAKPLAVTVLGITRETSEGG